MSITVKGADGNFYEIDGGQAKRCHPQESFSSASDQSDMRLLAPDLGSAASYYKASTDLDNTASYYKAHDMDASASYYKASQDLGSTASYY